MDDRILIGTAGWALKRDIAAAPEEGSSLERYSRLFGVAEINSSFHRSHRASTWLRWEQSVPPGFRFAAKLPKEITHRRRLADAEEVLDAALPEMAPLGPKLALLLVQLPPSLAYDPDVAPRFFEALRRRWKGLVACEPRHPTWLEGEADAALAAAEVARVAADPVRFEGADEPGGWRGLSYFRLHGSPVTYRSSYDDGRLEPLAARLRAEAERGAPVWCIFDNTASSAAAGDALRLRELLA